MSFDKLRETLGHTSPSFRCYCAGDRTEQLRLTARLRHILGKPATAEALAQLDSQLGNAGIVIRDLYAMHNGMTLYCDTKSESSEAQLNFFSPPSPSGTPMLPTSSWRRNASIFVDLPPAVHGFGGFSPATL